VNNYFTFNRSPYYLGAGAASSKFHTTNFCYGGIRQSATCGGRYHLF